MVIIEGHRGVGILGEHNCLESYQMAVDMKLDYIELDVYSTTDQKLVICHGKRQQVLFNNEKRFVRDLEYEAMKESGCQDIESGKWLPLPLLEEVMEICKGRTKINIEIKGSESRTLRLVLEAIQRFQMEDEVYISTFKHIHFFSLPQLIREVYGDNLPAKPIKFAFLVSRNSKRFNLSTLPPQNEYLPFTRVQINFSSKLIVEPDFLAYLDQARALGFEFGVYFSFTENENYQIYDQLLNLGVGHIITNQPLLAQSYQKYIQELKKQQSQIPQLMILDKIRTN